MPSSFSRSVSLISTLLSQVDSAVGGKTAINNSYGKNIIGTFYQPNFVLIDTDTLKTLPKREVFSGFAEILKYSLILDKKFFNWLHKHSRKIFTLNSKILSEAIYKSIIIKRKYVLKDEKEKLKNNNSRAILNFGHTFGHALETYYNYNKKLTHGEAISIGMIIASILSHKLGYLSLSHLNNIKNHFKLNNLPISDNKMFNEKFLYENALRKLPIQSGCALPKS